MPLTYALRPESPRLASTPASAFTRERRMLARYTELLYAPDRCPEELMRAVWAPGLTHGQMYGSRAGNPGKIDRLDEEVPDLIRQLLPDEQAPIAELLEAGDLVGTIQKLLGQYRGGARRDTDARLSDYKSQHLEKWETDPIVYHNDGWRLKAASMGRLTREAYGRPLDKKNPLVLTSPPPKLRAQRRARPKQCYRPAVQRCHLDSQWHQLTFWA